MGSSNIASYGKIRYIDPNNILQDKLYSENKSTVNGDTYLNTGAYNIPHNLEDYSIAIDLIVTIPKRIGDAKNETNTHRISLITNEGKISFFGGTDGLMTDTPGSTTYYDVLNKDLGGTQESLGITNIHITYNSYFVPEVTINFTDVRGAALMMPHEENYRRKKINEMNGVEYYDSTVENFFAALFSFPYPDFKLQVKGFYGKMVEYNLVVEDFRSAFNAQTGNFDATVKFIGKMYGVYTDIPMTYLLMAPYCKYGASNGLTKWQEHKFTLKDGIEMPTLLELKERVLKAHEKLATDLNYQQVQNYSAAQRRLNDIHNVKQAYIKLISYLKKKYGKNEKSDVILGEPLYEDLYLFKNYTQNNCEYLYEGEGNEFLSLSQNLYDAIIAFNQRYDAKIKLIDGLSERNKHIGSSYVDSYISVSQKGDEILCNISVPASVSPLFKTIHTNIGNKKSSSSDPSWRQVKLNSFKHKSTSQGGFPNVFNQLEAYVKKMATNDYSIKFNILCGYNFKESIQKIEADTKKEIDDLRKQIDLEYGARLESLLGFKPTIQNVVMITMAHLQTFVEIYASFLRNVTGINSRKLQDYGLSFDNTDIPNRGDFAKDTDLPPFPAIINNYLNEYEYPNNGVVTRTMEETRLIDEIFDGSFLMLGEIDRVNKEIESLKSSDVDFLPSCWTDYVIVSNPYLHTFDENEGTIDVDWIMTFFGIRCMTRFMIEKASDSTADKFGKYEAYNFWRANKGLKSDIIKKIKSSDFNESNFIGFLCNDTSNTYVLNNQPCYTFSSIVDVEYPNTGSGKDIQGTVNSLIVRKDDNSGHLYPRCYYAPVAIGRNATPFNSYKIDSNGSRGVWSMTRYMGDEYNRQNGSESKPLPYEYTKLLNVDFLTSWNEKIMSTDLSKILNEEEKKKFIEDYITVNKDIFYKWNIWFRETTSDLFYTKMKKGNVENGSVDLQQWYNGSGHNYILNSFKNYNNEPIFMENNLTPERFLCSIPFNISKINDYIGHYTTQESSRSNPVMHNTNRVTAIPYAFQLFLGMCIKRIKEKKLDGILTRVRTLYNVNYKSSPARDNDDVKRHILDILKFFLRNSKSKNCQLKPILSEENIINTYNIDIFGLEEKYNEWAHSTQPGGFLYLKNMYSFNGNNQYKKLKDLCKKTKNSTKDNNQEIQNIFNKNFIAIKRGTASIDGAMDFTDRYSNVIYVHNDDKANLCFNPHFEAYSHLYELLTKYDLLLFPYDEFMLDLEAPASAFNTAFKSFKNKLIELYTEIDPETGEEKTDYTSLSSGLVTTESKLSMYLTLKNLQDKHFSNLHNDVEKYQLGKHNCEFERFHFIDTFYNDIGDELIVDANQLEEVIDAIMNGYESGTGEGIIKSELSVYSFLANLCQKNNMMLMAMPVFNGALTGEEGATNLEDMFRPIPYDEIVNDYVMKGPSYICFYPHQPSKHLDIPNSQYSNDGFNLSTNMNNDQNFDDINNTANFLGPLSISDLDTINETGTKNYLIPAFAVEYGNMNQSIFTNVNVNMDNPMVTEYSVAAQFGLAQGKQIENRKLSFEGQNLFNVYSNHSYTCTVEMMGCAQIQPLMYFQLNNIPMFRGAYQIINVEHNITPGNMMTTFKGVRINKNKIPMVKTCINLNSMLDAMNTATLYEVEKNKKNVSEFEGTLPAASGGDGMDAIPRDAFYTHLDFTGLGKNFIIDKSIATHTSPEGSFDDANPSLRAMLYAIGQKMKSHNMGIKITSMTRTSEEYSPYKASDHSIGKMINGQWVFKGAARREKLTGKSCDVNENGDYIIKKYSEMGCAADMHGTLSNGTVDKINASIPLFHVIATEFTNNIRQLIWEIKSNTPVNSDSISNCIHLATYGPRGENGSDKTEIFVSSGGDPWAAIIANNKKDISKPPTNLPPMFIRTLCDMAKVGKLTSNITLNNFAKANIKNSDLTKELLESWCKELNV